MPFMPFSILGMWFRGLLSIAILAGGLLLLSRWYNDSYVVEQETIPIASAEDRPVQLRSPDERQPETTAVMVRRVFRFQPGWNKATLELAAAVVLLAWATLGRWIGQGTWMLMLRRPGAPPSADGSNDEAVVKGGESKGHRREKAGRQNTAATATHEPDVDPSPDRTGEVHTIRRPDGSELRVECYGPIDAPPLIWTHGWGANSTEWFYEKRYLAERFRLIVWDEPGLGLSKKPDNNDYRLEKLAADLHAVLELAGDRPAVLVGHSIGGMITLTFCKEYPETLGTRVAGLVLAHTTYTNPVRTTQMASLLTAIEKPVIIPLLYLTIGLWPLVWLANWMSYLNGSAHRSTHKSSFSGNETRGQLDFVARFMPHARPDILARGMLGMIAYDATATLARISIPTLVVVGDEDTTTKPEAGEYIATHIPRSELISLTPAKHMGLIEHHERFDRSVVEFAAHCQTVSAKR
jgi:pimeloyl-ACP methyl ester carboxylesterase